VSRLAPALTWVDGELREGEQPAFGPADRAALYGDGLFETVRVVGARALWLDRHLARFRRSARALGFPRVAELSRDGVRAARALLRHPMARKLERRRECVLRLTWTRGEGRGFAPAKSVRPRLVAQLFSPPPDLTRRRRGVRAIVAKGLVPGSLAGYKSCSALVYVEAARRARRAGADEALLEDGRGGITEASAANLFAVIDGALVTPPAKLPLLPGIVRAWVLSRRGPRAVRAREQPISLGQLRAAREAFLTSSVLGVAPLLRVNGTRIGSGRLGPVTRRLRAALKSSRGA
jgi:branched-subunit amino acid aminotransferase/4-amino-4-deoxychorismate lyase